VKLLIAPPNPDAGAQGCARHVIISEIAWAGTEADPQDEWIELRNLEDTEVDLLGWTLRWRRAKPERPEDEQWKIIALEGFLAPASTPARLELHLNTNEPASWWLDLASEQYRPDFLVLERGTDAAIGDLPAALVYDPLPYSLRTLDLSDAGEYLELLDSSGCLVDTANASQIGRGGWVAGDAAAQRSMERTDPLTDDRVDNWHTNLGIITYGVDAAGLPLYATPGAENEPVLETLAPSAQASAQPPDARGTLTIALPVEALPGGNTPLRFVALSEGSDLPLPTFADITSDNTAVQLTTSGAPVSPGRVFVWIRIGRTVLFVPLAIPL
jgi:hypothetical protein